MHTNTLKKLALALTFWLLVHYAPLKAQLTGPDFEVDTYGTITDTGTFGGTGTLSLSGTGTRMFWFPATGAFRAGQAVGASWNSSNIGNYSVAFGKGTTASGKYSVAFGTSTQATFPGSVAFGTLSRAEANYAIAMGYSSTASGNYSLAVGEFDTASGYAATAFGCYTTALGDCSLTTGAGTSASGYFSTAMGYCTTASAYDSFAVGAYNLGLSSTKAAANPNAWVLADPLFEVGNGNGGSAINGYTPIGSDAFVVYKNGDAAVQGNLTANTMTITAPSGQNGDIPMYTGN